MNCFKVDHSLLIELEAAIGKLIVVSTEALISDLVRDNDFFTL